jgi:hypothetical protein
LSSYEPFGRSVGDFIHSHVLFLGRLAFVEFVKLISNRTYSSPSGRERKTVFGTGTGGVRHSEEPASINESL